VLVVLTLSTIAFVACSVPARRAMRLDPIVTMRTEIGVKRSNDHEIDCPVSQHGASNSAARLLTGAFTTTYIEARGGLGSGTLFATCARVLKEAEEIAVAGGR
jgi:hypothetical protein